MLDNLEIEIKKWNQSYSFSSKDDDKKRVYTIYSPELKNKLREIISPFGTPAGVGFHYEGKNSQGDHILYQQGSGDDSPDQLTLMSREIAEKNKIIDKKKKKEEDKEWKDLKKEWKRQEEELGESLTLKSYFCFKDKNGKITEEGTYVKSENKSQLIMIGEKTPSFFRLQEKIAQAEKERLEKTEANNNDQKFILHQQIPSKK